MRQASKPFTLHVADAAITDLRARLARTRYPDEPPLPAWSTGTSLAYLESLIDYWQSGFDWRAWEAKLNAFPQFTLPLHGIDVHFIHAPSRKPGAPALVLSHGWPGSVFEFHKIIPLLTEHFTVVAPSLPGYTLSFKPGQPRFGVIEIAETFAALMTALGYEQFCAQGGDWGCFITSVLAHRFPQRLQGIHINLLPVGRHPAMLADPNAEEKSMSTCRTTQPAALACGAHLHRHPRPDAHAKGRPLRGARAARAAGRRHHRVLCRARLTNPRLHRRARRAFLPIRKWVVCRNRRRT